MGKTDTAPAPVDVGDLPELGPEFADDAPEGPALPGRGKKASGRSKPGPRAKDERIDAVRAQLYEQINEVAPLLFLPTAAEVWRSNARSAVDNLLVLAHKYPSLLKGLETGVVIFAALGLVNFGSAVGYGAACDLGLADPYSMPARGLGVTEAWQRVHPEEEHERAGDHGSAADEGEGTAAARRGALPVPAFLGRVPGGAPGELG